MVTFYKIKRDKLNQSQLTLSYLLFDNFFHPCATKMQNPMLGTYNTRSATTNPTGKKRFDAGMNGSTIKQRAYKRNANELVIKITQ